jgi:hypothetical protein
MHKQYERPKYFSLIYSKLQHDICIKHEAQFTPNTYKGQSYTEMKTGKTEDECRSNFKDAIVVFSGDINLYEKEKSNIEYL